METRFKLGKLSKKILLAMLKNGAMTVNELISFIEGEKAIDPRDWFGRIRETRKSSYWRTFKKLRRQGLIRMKTYHYKDAFGYWRFSIRPRNFKAIYGLTVH